MNRLDAVKIEDLARERILVVEDDQPLAHFLRLRLESAGFAVHAEQEGTSALHYAAEERPDLVILDLRLPDLHGYDVCRQLRRLYGQELPILMLTAMDQPVDELNGFAHGADAYLTKPFKASELLKTIVFLLERPP